MKIALLFRGPLRPSAAHTRHYVAEFKKNLDNLPSTPVTFLATWHFDAVDYDIRALITQDIDNVLAFNLPDEHLIGSDIFNSFLPSGHSARNIFYQHYVSKLAIDAICSHNDYDIVIHTRTDLWIDFGENFLRWLEPERINQYQAMHVRDIFPGSFLNDQFAMASPSVMRQAWDYGSLDNLRTKIRAVVASGGKGEDVLQSLLDDAGVLASSGPVITYRLDSGRHKSMPL